MKGRVNKFVSLETIAIEIHTIKDVIKHLIGNGYDEIDMEDLEKDTIRLYAKYCKKICIHTWGKGNKRRGYVGCCFYKSIKMKKIMNEKKVMNQILKELDIKMKNIREFNILFKKPPQPIQIVQPIPSPVVASIPVPSPVVASIPVLSPVVASIPVPSPVTKNM
jgi:hypothetical protein